MIPFQKCPICGGDVVNKKIEKLLKGGSNTAVVVVDTEVCLHCGGIMYSKDTVSLFEQIRFKLAKQETGDFEEMGRAFKVGQLV